jgi:hypothetical protein
MTGVLAVALVLAFASTGQGAAKKLKVKELHRGSIFDEKLRDKVPKSGVLDDRKDYEKLLTAWKVTKKLPKVDFRKQLVVVVATRRARLLPINATLSGEGDLQVVTGVTGDLQPGFRYILAVVPRAGVKTVNGEKLKD